MKKNRLLSVALSALLVLLMMTGCMNGGVTPGSEPSAAPVVTAEPGAEATNALQSGAEKAFDWLTQGVNVESRINMLSEIQESRVIVDGQTALVGVTFAEPYQGELTQRIRDMVAGEVQAADAGVQSVAVTAAQEDVEKINEMADQIRTGTPVGQLQDEIESIIRNVTTIQ